MRGTLDDLYLTWLYRQVGSVKEKNPANSHWVLFRQLYSTEFTWSVPNDDNRCADGHDLRYEFLNGNEIEDIDWLNLGCSTLEMLIALARRASFETDEQVSYWFFKLLENLGLNDCTDADPLSHDEIDNILQGVIRRTYQRDGRGGLFPLRYPDSDQRRIEIWYQLSAYLLEHAE